MTGVRTAHTADIDSATRGAVQELLEDVFDDLTAHDFEHALGGVHALVWDGSDLIGHASVIQRRLLHEGRALRTGYVEGVAVRAGRRGEGHGGALLAALERVILQAYTLGALSATDDAARFYAQRGWLQWEGPSGALTPDGIVRTPADDGSIFVFPVAESLDRTRALVCDWRDGDAW